MSLGREAIVLTSRRSISALRALPRGVGRLNMLKELAHGDFWAFRSVGVCREALWEVFILLTMYSSFHIYSLSPWQPGAF